MAFEMENSSTGNAAKLAVLWRDRGGGSGSGLPDRLLTELLAGAWVPGDTRPPAERETIFTSSKDLESVFEMVADLRAAFAAPGSYGAPLATGPLSPLVKGGNDPLNPTPFRGVDLHETLTDIRTLTHGTSATALRNAATSGGLASIMSVLLDLKFAVFGFGPADTQRVGDWIPADAEADLPFIKLGMLHALRHLAGRVTSAEESVVALGDRLATAERRIRDLKART